MEQDPVKRAVIGFGLLFGVLFVLALLRGAAGVN